MLSYHPRATHESKRKDGDCRDGVQQHANTEDLDVPEGDDQVPEKVASCHTLQHATSTVVSPNPAGPVHVPSFIVEIHDVQCSRVDNQ